MDLKPGLVRWMVDFSVPCSPVICHDGVGLKWNSIRENNVYAGSITIIYECLVGTINVSVSLKPPPIH